MSTPSSTNFLSWYKHSKQPVPFEWPWRNRLPWFVLDSSCQRHCWCNLLRILVALTSCESERRTSINKRALKPTSTVHTLHLASPSHLSSVARLILQINETHNNRKEFALRRISLAQQLLRSILNTSTSDAHSNTPYLLQENLSKSLLVTPS